MLENELDTTRTRLLEAAGEMFSERGFENTTVRDICQEAGANLAAVNYHFGDKERLYTEAVLRAHRWCLERVSLPDWDESTTAEQKLADFIVTFFRRVLNRPGDAWQPRLVMREVLQPSAACAEMARSNIRPEFELLKGILRELLPDDLSVEELHLTAFSVVGQCLFYFFADGVIRNLIVAEEYAGNDAEKLAAHVTKFCLAAISARTPTKQQTLLQSEVPR
ncbi:MAG: CerR family C-terminal domain-containing protein [Bythopirellula sp.]|nr:CerR family C-terminal domain-containing protein [Bythopirellula sp.]